MSEVQFYRSMTGLPLVGALVSVVLSTFINHGSHTGELNAWAIASWLCAAHVVGLPYYMAFTVLGLVYLWRKPSAAYRRFGIFAPILFCAAFFSFSLVFYLLGNYGGMAALRTTDLPLVVAIGTTILGLGYFYILLSRVLLSIYSRRGWVARHAA